MTLRPLIPRELMVGLPNELEIDSKDPKLRYRRTRTGGGPSSLRLARRASACFSALKNRLTENVEHGGPVKMAKKIAVGDASRQRVVGQLRRRGLVDFEPG